MLTFVEFVGLAGGLLRWVPDQDGDRPQNLVNQRDVLGRTSIQALHSLGVSLVARAHDLEEGNFLLV